MKLQKSGFAEIDFEEKVIGNKRVSSADSETSREVKVVVYLDYDYRVFDIAKAKIKIFLKVVSWLLCQSDQSEQ